ncbi:hypothetical protein [Bradyrhizobium sp. LA2.1]|uniref:hypothetical protein n=1 Tax=Bradyrhizobium sp. LA2.1 TaxID=3156376 RepID=UPI0033909AA4
MPQWPLDVLDAINRFSAEMFRSIATSPAALLTITALAAASFAIAHLPFVALIVPRVKPYMQAASLVSVLSFAVLCFLIGVKSERTRGELERAKSDLAFKEFQLGNQVKAAADAADLKADADAQAQEARGKLSVYQEKFGSDPNAARCAPRAGVIDWLHDLQRRKQAAGAVTTKPKRGLVARLRRSGTERR